MDAALLIGSCVFIDFFRSSTRHKAYLRELFDRFQQLHVSSIAKYEILCETLDKDIVFWNMIFHQIRVLPFDDSAIMTARGVNQQLKQEELGDILIATTAIVIDLPLTTFNHKHFERIRGLRLV
jgi:tRNA(fMet)-specific endonuclease VapC